MANAHTILFYTLSGFVSIILAVGYMWIPCEVPTDFNLFLFVNRAIYNVGASLVNMAATLLFLPENVATPGVAMMVVMVYSILDQLKTRYLQKTEFFSTYAEVFNVTNYTSMFVIFAFWGKLGCSWIMAQFVVLVLTMYVFVCVLQIVAIDGGSEQDPLIQTLIFVAFFVWCTLCQRVMQSLSRRIACGIAAREGRAVEWFDLVRSQCFLFHAYSLQGAYYRQIFIAVNTWYMEVVLIAMHVAQELILYPLRAHPTVREWERSFLSRTSLGRRVLHPVLPMSVNIDIHCMDYTLRKVAEVTQNLLFVARCVVCRYGYMSPCYSPATWSTRQLQSLLILSAAVFVTEIASGVLGVYFMKRQGVARGFVTGAVTEGKSLRGYFVLVVVTTSCSVTFADALRHVKF